MVAVYEAVKKEEHDKRALYKNETNELEEEIAQLTNRLQSSSEIETEDMEQLKQTEEQYQLVADRLHKQRLILVSRSTTENGSLRHSPRSFFQAKKVREISAINRRMDDIPSAIELAQYRQAFFQLYNQSAVLYRQTKQNYTIYNTFTDMIDYMNKEVNLIESVYQGYPQWVEKQDERGLRIHLERS